MGRKVLDFQARISDLEQINPTFSTCKIKVMHTGENRNLTMFDKNAIERALPSLKNIPIIGEFSVEADDYKGHGGRIDLDSFDFVHTTKPYGVVPESATYEWEEVNGREYLVIHGCYLWTGRYEEAKEVIKHGKGQSMEIEVIDGVWDESLETYRINNFIFSALCILGDNVEPAFEDAKITSYSLDKKSFKNEFTKMMRELKFSLSNDEEEDKMLKEILKRYSLTVEQLTEKGIDFNNISEEELEDKILEVFELGKIEPEEGNKEPEAKEPEGGAEPTEPVEPVEPESKVVEPEDVTPVEETKEFKLLKNDYEKLEEKFTSQSEELESLREYKKNIEKDSHEAEVLEMFAQFQLTEEDVKDIDIHEFSVEDIQEKCFAIIGRKMASKKSFSKENKEGKGFKLPLGNEPNNKKLNSRYGNLLD